MLRKASSKLDLARPPGGGAARHRLDFDRPKPFPMSFGLMGAAVGDKAKTKKIAPSSRSNLIARPESFRQLAAEVIVVAIDGSKSITRHALEWALSNVVQPGDRIILLALLPSSSGWKFWKFAKFARDSSTKDKIRQEETRKSCQCMMEQLQSLFDAKKVQTTVKIYPSAEKGATTIEAKKLQATWVVLDRHLKKEEKRCSDNLQCNLVIVDRYNPKILRLNLKQSPEATPLEKAAVPPPLAKQAETPASSPDVGTPFTSTSRGNSSCSESSTSPFSGTEPGSYQTTTPESFGVTIEDVRRPEYGASESDSDDPTVVPRRWRNSSRNLSTKDHSKNKEYKEARQAEGKRSSTPVQRARISPIKQRISSDSRLSTSMREGGSRQSLKTILNPAAPRLSSSGTAPKLALSDLLTSCKLSSELDERNNRPNCEEATSIRRAVSLTTHSPLEPPPLCSICQHKAPVFGRPPREFTFEELELATGGFSQANFLAEGGFGSVHRGVLPEGQVVAVKQHKLASSQGDVEFCSEVEVLSCAQHRNVVMLIGYCMEDSRRLLVYEFICNNSLDAHLYGKTMDPLEWKYRQRVAIGAARGLRYLHEECRVGCIVHRDMRPNNILLTHDYEPMVGDFGLARWQPDGELGVETRVIGTFGYLAPEYTQSGQITEKADVYSFGIVLLELVTGRKAIDISRPKGQQCLTEWARPLLRKRVYRELVDPKLCGEFEKDEVTCMLHAAFLCISRDPNTRPRMSQVLRILEGEMIIDPAPASSLSDEDIPSRPVSEPTRRSTSAISSRKNRYIPSSVGHYSSGAAKEDGALARPNSGNLTLEELKAAYRHKLGHRRLSLGDAL
ncbi:inactive protein kinase SELMODRAFT_444075-like isoform X2 [Selaginella moellendorffii]|uniref:inactive protein kinase SELMODRAFT_444075-like isoform X2 n=1 Tax=Selaginella moellendorffii TaxID=88036 RepID=UPI000D1C4BA2|nr:inactive protein kinase SELMODRAFT_444075-like isoform X2 [Selaginella moellendorffii]|eukprot:XP_024525140.1 inactive protein kinase SELMODRAFT_444075-like isoform X2 [Selaginella moellendorffii]